MADKDAKKSGRSLSFHGETWHGGQSYKKLLADGEFPSNNSRKWMERQDSAAQPLVPPSILRRQVSSPMARVTDASVNLDRGSDRRLPPVEATVHGAEPAVPDHRFWRVRQSTSTPRNDPLQRQPSNLVLVLPRAERVLDIGEEGKRDPPGSSIFGGIGASFARTLSMSLSGLSQRGRPDERDRQPVMLDEAFCRICLDQLGEGESWRLECHCKGDMALAHEECALKWFNLRGTRSCEVCGSEVDNLPVILERRQEGEADAVGATNGATNSQEDPQLLPKKYRDIPSVFIAGCVAYFCFFEQMLVPKEGKNAVATSIPAAVILSVVSTAVAARTDPERMWGLGIVQFIFTILFAQLLYTLGKIGGPGASFFGGLLGIALTAVLHAILRDMRRYHSRTRAAPENAHGTGIAAIAGQEMTGLGSDAAVSETTIDLESAPVSAEPSTLQEGQQSNGQQSVEESRP